ncbi:MAG: alpha/beta hydrolase [Eubacterium sp.]|nr:alpha/beta hydrolase [Eubacterium sp.]
MQRKVTFKNNIWDLTGILYLPEDFDADKKYPALVFGNPGGSVKEQTPADYGKGLSKAGFVVLTFDACHQGESGGEPRLLDNPYERSEDIRCGVDFLTTLPYVDRARIGALGQCAGSGFAIFAALTDRRIKAVCGLCCTNPGATTRQGWDGTRSVAENIKTLDRIAEQRTAEANGEAVAYAHYVPELEEIDEDTAPDMVIGNQFYRKEARHPNSPNLFKLTGLAHRMTFDAYAFIPDYLDRPFLVVAGSEAGSLWQSLKAYEMANEPKELCVMEGAGHFDFYNNPVYIDRAVAKMATFFGKYL